jgi:hypothetical protein
MKDIDTLLVIQGISYHYSNIYYSDVTTIMVIIITIISLQASNFYEEEIDKFH